LVKAVDEVRFLWLPFVSVIKGRKNMKLEELEKKYAELGKEIEALKNKPEYDYDLAIELGCFFKFRDVDDEDYAIVDQLSDYDHFANNSFVTKLNEGAWGEIEPVKERGHIQLHDGSAECPVPVKDIDGNNTTLIVLYRNGRKVSDRSPSEYRWAHKGTSGDIVAFVWL